MFLKFKFKHNSAQPVLAFNFLQLHTVFAKNFLYILRILPHNNIT